MLRYRITDSKLEEPNVLTATYLDDLNAERRRAVEYGVTHDAIIGPPLLVIARRIWYIEPPRVTLDPCAAAKKLMSLRQFTEQLNDKTSNNQEADSSS